MMLSTDQEEEAAVAAKANPAMAAAASSSQSSHSLLSDLAVHRPSRWSAAAAPQLSLNSAAGRRRAHPETPQMLTLGRCNERSNDEYEINPQAYHQQNDPHSPPSHRQRMINNSRRSIPDFPNNVADEYDTDIIMRRHANASLVESEDGAVAVILHHHNRSESSWWPRAAAAAAAAPLRFWNARAATEYKETLVEPTTESTTTEEYVFHLANAAAPPHNHSRPKSPRRTTRSWPTAQTPSFNHAATAVHEKETTSYRVLDDNNHTTTATKVKPKPSNGEMANMDCSFFFRESDHDDDDEQAAALYNSLPNRSFPPNFSPVAMRRNYRHSQLYEYQDAVPVMARPVLAQFQTRYHQLNQELVYPKSSRHSPQRPHPNTMDPLAQFWPRDNDDTEPDPWDDMATLQSLRLQTLLDSSLHLTSSEPTDGAKDNENATGLDQAYHPAPPHGRRRRAASSVGQSTEWVAYQISDASRRKVPRDQVRLLMDPDLEAGILSVEQWRCPETANEPGSAQRGRDENDGNDHAPSSFQTEPPTVASSSPPPPLRYVLTVSDDLYRSVVAEMSPTTTKYFCCPRACCNEDERADIRVAVYLLLVILVVLFINTMAFHEH
jgi:hypothetical protein